MAALGGARIVGSTPHTLVELAAAVAKGLPGAVVTQLAANAAPNEVEARRRVAALVTSTASLKRRARLSPAASERAERSLGLSPWPVRRWETRTRPGSGSMRHILCWARRGR